MDSVADVSQAVEGEVDRQRAAVTTWLAAGPVLAEVRRREVVALTDASALRATVMLFTALDQFPRQPLRSTSGLAEQQRLFALLHPR